MSFVSYSLPFYWLIMYFRRNSTLFICKVVVIGILMYQVLLCFIFYCDPFILISCLYCYFRPVTCSYAGFWLVVCSYLSFSNFVAVHMQLCWLVGSDMSLVIVRYPSFVLLYGQSYVVVISWVKNFPVRLLTSLSLASFL